MFGDALAELAIDSRDRSFAVEFDKAVALGHDFELALDHRLVANEGPVEIVRERHVATRFPITDGLGFFEFAGERGFGTHVKPEGEVRTKSHGVQAGEGNHD